MSIAVMWFRQDLRLEDNPAFTAACDHHELLPLYIYDTKKQLQVGAAQDWWLHHSLQALSQSLNQHQLQLCLRKGDSLSIWQELLQKHQIAAVYWNRCYEPATIARDKKIKSWLKEQGIQVITSNGLLFNEPWTITNQQGDYFKVFSAYWRHCMKGMQIPPVFQPKQFPHGVECQSESLIDWHLLPQYPNWAEAFHSYWQPGAMGALCKLEHFIDAHLAHYKPDRDVPIKDATTKLSPHLHFGEISPWTIWRAIQAQQAQVSHNSIDSFLSELGWREFSYYLLYHFPSLPMRNFRPEFDAFIWENDEISLKAWQLGKTGYPLVDAGMRELWHTGYMHNRVRMVVASFLTKNLLIDWRKGAQWFEYCLLDADLANNSASWQWVAGSGADAAPYFRIFNPVLQSEKFDPQGEYIKKWVPELRSVQLPWLHKPWEAPPAALGIQLGHDYPHPIANHQLTRQLALERYQLLKQVK